METLLFIVKLLGLALLLSSATPLIAQEATSPAQGAVPAQPAVYVPLTVEERWEDYLRRSFSPNSLATRAARSAFTSSLSNNPPEWRNGWDGFGKRFGSSVGQAWIRRGMESAGAAAIGHDPRYIPCPCDGPWKRVAHAFAQSAMTYDNQGHRVFGYARVGSRYASSMLEMTWFPDRYSWKDGFREGSQSFVRVGVFNIAREFWPDIKAKLKRKKK